MLQINSAGLAYIHIPVNIQYTKYRYVQYKYSTINDSSSGIYKKMI